MALSASVLNLRIGLESRWRVFCNMASAAVQQAVRNSVILIIVFGFILTWFFYFLGA